MRVIDPHFYVDFYIVKNKSGNCKYKTVGVITNISMFVPIIIITLRVVNILPKRRNPKGAPIGNFMISIFSLTNVTSLWPEVNDETKPL